MRNFESLQLNHMEPMLFNPNKEQNYNLLNADLDNLLVHTQIKFPGTKDTSPVSRFAISDEQFPTNKRNQPMPNDKEQFKKKSYGKSNKNAQKAGTQIPINRRIKRSKARRIHTTPTKNRSINGKILSTNK